MGLLEAFSNTLTETEIETANKKLKREGLYGDDSRENDVVIPDKLKPVIAEISQTVRKKLYEANAPSDYIHDAQHEFTDLCKFCHALDNRTTMTLTEDDIHAALKTYSRIFRKLSKTHKNK